MKSSRTCWIAACASLEEAGFEQYEVSGYARAGASCAHNLNYWKFGDYLGIGAGAHGKLSFPDRGFAVRTQQTREPRRYLAADPARWFVSRYRQTGSAVRVRNERLSTRATDSRMNFFESRTGLPIAVLEQALAPLVARGLVERSEKHWRATAKGFRFLNDILVELLPPTPSTATALIFPAPPRERFYAQMPSDGHVNNGITAGFSSVAL